MRVRITHITGHTGRIPTKQITVNRELFLEEKKNLHWTGCKKKQ